MRQFVAGFASNYNDAEAKYKRRLLAAGLNPAAGGTPSGSDRKSFRRDAAGFEEFPDLQNFGFRQAVIGVMEGGLLSLERHFDPAALRVFDVGAQFGQHVVHVLEIDVGAHGMSKQRMENFPMMVIHVLPQLVTIVGAASLRRKDLASLTQVKISFWPAARR
jgi:hypothetical protein